MKTWLCALLAMTMTLGFASAAGWAGSYSATGGEGRGSYVLSVILKKEDGAWTLSGGAGYENGSSVAPEFTGEILEEDGNQLSFAFTDSFDNEGTIRLSKQDYGVEISFEVNEVREARCLALYEENVLEKD